MAPLQMVDLKRQYLKIKPQIDAAIANVIDTTAFINGPDVKLFAQELQDYLQVKHVIPCANGTDAIQIALMALGLKPGDEVITPSFTYIATVEVVALLGLKPVFVEVDEATFTMTPESLKAAITPETKAIIPVHLYGQSAAMKEILDIAAEHNIPVIEDTAQAIGGTYTFPDGTKKMNGTMGAIGTTSFFPSKNLGCYGDGGAIFTNDDVLAEKLYMIANHGQKVKYYHDMVGCNSRLDTIQAAILRIKLRELDGYCDTRRAVADYYDNAFANHANIITPKRASYSHHVYHQYTLQLDNVNRDKVQEKLTERGIPSMIYYPVPSHKQKMFDGMDVEQVELATTDYLNKRVISLPIHTEMTEEEMQFITRNFIEVVNELTAN
ncbi:DegT/DnrJ/EryC1/StrS family aminotransferase [Taibaiella lutea]|uniref:DegT/DnrJ/EryC1/StrS family aminotransferase n=1 Tax=Taibaiella lutea TaxID=2608001 RepID=A0A5M6CNF8_9BACT|nr:DegT/DnrJ/EryC1/StrS family aminotransferase [Taibaiella lutea]KAA5536741.1 DegT/DnrJ/EryC1/StrS family aminotransferase [Taibaiella lutea]